MDATFFPVWLTELEYLFWLAQGAAFLLAAIFFFRADRQHHTICFLIGSSLGFLLVLWQAYDYSMIAGWIFGDPIEENSETYYSIQSGIAILANGLMAYGIVVIGLIHFRRMRLSKTLDP